jgi:hypothetical protein
LFHDLVVAMPDIVVVSIYRQSDSVMVIVTPLLGGNIVSNTTQYLTALPVGSSPAYQACRAVKPVSISFIRDNNSKTNTRIGDSREK